MWKYWFGLSNSYYEVVVNDFDVVFGVVNEF